MKQDITNQDIDKYSSEEEVNIKELLTMCFNNRIWFILSFIAMVAFGVLYVKTKPNIYSRTATVIVEDERRGGSTSEAAAFQEIFNMGGGSVYNEIGLFESNRFMYDVVERLNLETQYKLDQKLRTADLYKSSPIEVTYKDMLPDQAFSFTAKILGTNQVELKDFVLYKVGAGDENVELEDMVVNLKEPISTICGEFAINPTLFMNESSVGKEIIVKHMSIKSTARAYSNILKVELVDKYASLVTISISDENVQRAEDIINTLIEVYRDDAIEDKNTILSNTSKFIDERLAIIEADLTAVDAEIEEFKRTNKLTDIASESSVYITSVSKLDEENFRIFNQLSMTKYMKSYLEDKNNIDALLPVNLGIESSGLNSQIEQYNDYMSKRNKLVSNSSETNPLVVDIQNILTGMRSSILMSVDNLIANLQIQAQNFARKERENLDKIKNIPSQQKYLISIQRQQTIKEQLYLYLLNKKEESELQRSITESNCRIVDYAEGSSAPIAPNKKLILLICAILGLVIPAVVLYVIQIFNTSVMSRKDIKGKVSIPYLGTIPMASVKPDNHLIVQDSLRDSIGEAFRIVRDNIEFMNNKSDGRGAVLQFTSLNPNSGKTFISINTAMSLALTGAKVVVVDLDIRKGTISKIAGIGVKQVGVSQYLSGKVNSYKDIVRPFATDVAFEIVSSGILPPNPAELLKGDRLNVLFNELRADYDYIIVDNPPYGAVVDTAICARVCDQTIYVIRSGAFDKRLLPDIQELYDTAKLPNMALLLNGVNTDGHTYDYGYGYGYSYGDYTTKKKSLIRRILGI